MLSLKNIVAAAIVATGIGTLAGDAEAQYYPQGYNQQFGYEQPRLTRRQIERLRAREQLRRERLAREQFRARQRYRQRQYYEETYVPRQPAPYYGGPVIVQRPQEYYFPQQQYIPQQPRYVPQQPRYIPQQPRYVPQPQIVPQPRQGWRGPGQDPGPNGDPNFNSNIGSN